MATRLGNFVAICFLAASTGAVIGLLSLITHPIEKYGVIPHASQNQENIEENSAGL